MYLQDDCASCEKYPVWNGTLYSAVFVWVWIIFLFGGAFSCLFVIFFLPQNEYSLCVLQEEILALGTAF